MEELFDQPNFNLYLFCTHLQFTLPRFGETLYNKMYNIQYLNANTL